MTQRQLLRVVAPLVLSLCAALLPAAEPRFDDVDNLLARKGKALPGNVVKYAWPRTDLSVKIAGVDVNAGLALTSWAAFLPLGAGGGAMAMGDLVLLDDEVARVVPALQAGGLEVAAIHNHLLGETPHVAYVHFQGHGAPIALAKALASALDETKTPREPAPSSTPDATEDAAFKKVQEALGRTGTMSGRVLQVGVARPEAITENGMTIPPSMGMSTSLNFQASGEKVASTGDFVLLAAEVNPVARELTAHGIHVTALHSHMLAESPRLFFMHFWVVDAPGKVGEGLKAALARMKTK